VIVVSDMCAHKHGWADNKWTDFKWSNKLHIQ